MKAVSQLFLAFCAISSALAVEQKKSAIVYFDNPDIPDSVVDQAKDSIIQAGGKITHVYSIIRKGTRDSANLGNRTFFED
ncbi:hypothetical protein E4U21_001254 [Claviceps maximensis]|nr:hypothetical protein E4U21_001254 [Claviceps maximensis]